MRDIARLSEKDKKALFHNTAAKMGMTDAIIEKDFWVCFMLDYLFHRCQWKNNIAFKGGTSLSKSYGLIERFSEDIDKYTAKKFGVLKKYLDKYGLQGGIVRQDKQSSELCICTESYSDDIKSDSWVLLSDIM